MISTPHPILFRW